MDIENSPSAQAGRQGPAARDSLGQCLLGTGEMCGNCLCCMALRDPCRERRIAALTLEHGIGVLWHHAASTLNAANPIGGGRVFPEIGMTFPVSIGPAAPQPLQRAKNRPKPSLANCRTLPYPDPRGA